MDSVPNGTLGPGVIKRVQERDCHRFVAVEPHPVDSRASIFRPYKHLGPVGERVVQAGTILSPDLDDVFETGRRDQQRPGSGMFEKGIGRGRRAVEEGFNAIAELARSDDHRLALLHRCRDLRSCDLDAVPHDDVGERTANVGSDDLAGCGLTRLAVHRGFVMAPLA